MLQPGAKSFPGGLCRGRPNVSDAESDERNAPCEKDLAIPEIRKRVQETRSTSDKFAFDFIIDGRANIGVWIATMKVVSLARIRRRQDFKEGTGSCFGHKYV